MGKKKYSKYSSWKWCNFCRNSIQLANSFSWMFFSCVRFVFMIEVFKRLFDRYPPHNRVFATCEKIHAKKKKRVDFLARFKLMKWAPKWEKITMQQIWCNKIWIKCTFFPDLFVNAIRIGFVVEATKENISSVSVSNVTMIIIVG